MLKIDWSYRGKKSADEIEFERLCDLYYEKFGVAFGYSVGGHCPATHKEAIKEVQYCLDNNKKKKREPMDENVKY